MGWWGSRVAGERGSAPRCMTACDCRGCRSLSPAANGTWMGLLAQNAAQPRTLSGGGGAGGSCRRTCGEMPLPATPSSAYRHSMHAARGTGRQPAALPLLPPLAARRRALSGGGRQVEAGGWNLRAYLRDAALSNALQLQEVLALLPATPLQPAPADGQHLQRGGRRAAQPGVMCGTWMATGNAGSRRAAALQAAVHLGGAHVHRHAFYRGSNAGEAALPPAWPGPAQCRRGRAWRARRASPPPAGTPAPPASSRTPAPAPPPAGGNARLLLGCLGQNR